MSRCGHRLRGLVLCLLMGLLPGSSACFRCVPQLAEAFDELYDKVEHSESAKRMVQGLEETYTRFSIMAQYVLDRLLINLRREITFIIKQKLKDDVLSTAIEKFVYLTGKAIRRELAYFHKNVECKNHCGNFTLKFIQCSDCSQVIMACAMKIDCGVMEVTVGENDELLLDCFQPWHRISTNFKSYIFAKAPLGSRYYWQFETMVEMKESSLEFLRVHKEHERTYRCVVMGDSGEDIARTLYDVHVGQQIPETTEFTFTRPSLGTEEWLPTSTRAPQEGHQLSDMNLVSIVAIVVLSLSVLALGGFLCYSTLGCQKRPAVDKSRDWMQLIR